VPRSSYFFPPSARVLRYRAIATKNVEIAQFSRKRTDERTTTRLTKLHQAGQGEQSESVSRDKSQRRDIECSYSRVTDNETARVKMIHVAWSVLRARSSTSHRYFVNNGARESSPLLRWRPLCKFDEANFQISISNGRALFLPVRSSPIKSSLSRFLLVYAAQSLFLPPSGCGIATIWTIWLHRIDAIR
jgi:hypothetical protein